MQVTGKCLCNQVTVAFDSNSIVYASLSLQRLSALYGAGKLQSFIYQKHLTLSGQLKFYEVKGKLGLESIEFL